MFWPQSMELHREDYMCKIINDEETIENLEKAFFFPISSLKNILISLCDHNRHGIAYGSDCTLRLSSWYEGDEKKSDDYIGDGNIEIIGWEPYFEEDIKVVMTNEQFLVHLKRFVEIYKKKYPEEIDIEYYFDMVRLRLDSISKAIQ